MANIILYQTGNKSRDPKTGTYYDPWDSHIWICIEQIRKWNENIDIYMITDDCEISNEDNFVKFNIKREYTYELNTKYDVENTSYYSLSINPSERACGLRPFYIESVIRKYNLINIFSFDNDVLIYCDLEEISKKLEKIYERSALTPDSKERMVLGMCYIKDKESIGDITEILWKYMNTDMTSFGYGKYIIDMQLWNLVYNEKGKSYVNILPTWCDGLFSDNIETIGGIFDPSSIGQFLLGCDNGNPPGTLFTNHYIHDRLKEGNYEFQNNYEGSKRYLSVFNKQNSTSCKILSIHVHNKKLKLLI
jgi:hypothetical protein